MLVLVLLIRLFFLDAMINIKEYIYIYDIDSSKTELLYESKNELTNSFELLE